MTNLPSMVNAVKIRSRPATVNAFLRKPDPRFFHTRGGAMRLLFHRYQMLVTYDDLWERG